jgi:hypothetical protein
MLNRHFFHRISHYAMSFFLAMQIGIMTLAVLDIFTEANPWVVVIVGFGVFFAGVIGIITWLIHRRRLLCEECIEQMPLDGAEKAAQWDRHLATVHVLDHWWGLLLVLAYLGSGYILEPLIGRPGSDIFSSGIAVWYLWSIIRHAKVVPWCKRCGWDEGGGEEWVPEPDPSLYRR